MLNQWKIALRTLAKQVFANKMQEDYIFNFDYLKETNSITQEQYDAIKQYEIDIYNVNNELYPIENKIQFYQNKITELKAKKTVYENSVKLDVEQKDKNSELGALLIQRNSSNPSGGYIDSHNATNPDVSIISQDKQGIYCIKLGTKEKGIHTDSVNIYRQYNSASNQFIGDPLTGFTFAYDEYNNPTAIYGIAPDENLTQPNTVYLTYTFEPKLYYDAISPGPGKYNPDYESFKFKQNKYGYMGIKLSEDKGSQKIIRIMEKDMQNLIHILILLILI